MTNEQKKSIQSVFEQYNLVKPDQVEQYLAYLQAAGVPFHVFGTPSLLPPFEKTYATTEVLPGLVRRMIEAGLMTREEVVSLAADDSLAEFISPAEIALFFPESGSVLPFTTQSLEHYRRSGKSDRKPQSSREKWTERIELQQALDFYLYLLHQQVRRFFGIVDDNIEAVNQMDR